MESENQATPPVTDIPSPQAELPQGKSHTLSMGPGRIILFGLVGAAVFVVICLAVFPIFQLPLRLAAPFPPPNVVMEREARINWNHMMNAIVAMGILGALVGGMLAVGESSASGFRGRSVPMIALAVIIAAALGALGGFAGHVLQNQLTPIKSLAPMGRTVLVQMLALGVLGAGLGIGVGLISGGVRHALGRAAMGGTAGLLGGLLFPVVCAFVASRAKTEVVVPGGVIDGRSEWLALALWAGLFILILSIILPMEHRRQKTGK